MGARPDSARQHFLVTNRAYTSESREMYPRPLKTRKVVGAGASGQRGNPRTLFTP